MIEMQSSGEISKRALYATARLGAIVLLSGCSGEPINQKVESPFANPTPVSTNRPLEITPTMAATFAAPEPTPTPYIFTAEEQPHYIDQSTRIENDQNLTTTVLGTERSATFQWKTIITENQNGDISGELAIYYGPGYWEQTSSHLITPNLSSQDLYLLIDSKIEDTNKMNILVEVSTSPEAKVAQAVQGTINLLDRESSYDILIRWKQDPTGRQQIESITINDSKLALQEVENR